MAHRCQILILTTFPFACGILAAQNLVTSVTAVAAPAEYSGECPVQIRFSATLAAKAGGVVSYQWQRSDGAIAPVEKTEVRKGDNTVTTTWTLGGDSDYQGWQSLRILDPDQVESKPAPFAIHCVLRPSEFQFKIDPGLKPEISELRGLQGESRPVARLIGPSGQATDFVADELVVAMDRGDVLDSFLRRWGGHLLWTLDTDAIKGMRPIHLVRVDTRLADASRLGADMESLGATGGEFRVSSEAGLKLLSVAGEEIGRRGIPLAINFMAPGSSLTDRRVFESAWGPAGWNSNPFTWPYMSRLGSDPASVQNIGVGDAWRAFELTGTARTQVPVAVLDSGFQRMPDISFDLIENPLRDLTPSPANRFPCAGGPCPWHGTNVISAMAGLVDNGSGAAGPAGTVARVLAVERGAPDFFGVISALINSIRALASGQRIVNMSFGMGMDAGVSIFAIPVVDPLFALTRLGGTLVVAAAGNDGIDVDRPGLFGLEAVYEFPCEAPGVLCVGGLGWNSRMAHPSSNFGSAFGRQADSVDLFGPFTTWVEADPMDSPSDLPKLVNGTSIASPFVAGVAALISSANPSLSADQIESILLRTMNTGGPGEAPGWVNAFAAVTSLIGAPPDDFLPTISIVSPRDGTAVDAGRRVTLVGAAGDREGAVNIEWRLPDGSRASGPSASYVFRGTGPQTVHATVRDSRGQAVEALPVTVRVLNPPPMPVIQWPRDGDHILVGSALTLRGIASDRNEGPGEYAGFLSGSALTWSDGSAMVLGTGNELSVRLSLPGFQTITLVATDSMGASNSVSVRVEIVSDPARVTQNVSILRPLPNEWITVEPDSPIRVEGITTFPAGVEHVWYADWLDSAGLFRTAEIGRNVLSFDWVPGAVLPNSGGFLDVAVRLVAYPRDEPPRSARVRLRIGFPPR